jgi:hypothetical protein
VRLHVYRVLCKLYGTEGNLSSRRGVTSSGAVKLANLNDVFLGTTHLASPTRHVIIHVVSIVSINLGKRASTYTYKLYLNFKQK